MSPVKLGGNWAACSPILTGRFYSDFIGIFRSGVSDGVLGFRSVPDDGVRGDFALRDEPKVREANTRTIAGPCHPSIFGRHPASAGGSSSLLK